jgi:putative inorganic carbon (hco3(-)) transporter
MLKKINWQQVIFFLFNFLVLATPFVFTFVNDELFEFNKMLFIYAMTILVFITWALREIAHKKFFFKKTALDIPILLFLLSQILATIFSIHQRTSLIGYYSRLNGGLLSTLTYITLYYALVSNLEKRHVLSIIKTALLGGILVSLYAIPEHFGLSPSCILINQTFDTSCWIQDVQSRVFATFGQPNWLAAYLIALIPIIWAMVANKMPNNKKLARRTDSILCCPYEIITGLLMTIALIFTKSKSGFLGLGAALFFLICVYLINKFKIKIKKRLFLFLVIPIITLVFYFSNSLFFNSTDINSGTKSGEIRTIVWKGALKVWQRYPIFGSGVETFAYSYYLDRPLEHNLVSEWDFLYNKAHNEFLNLLATTGIFGLLSYLFLLSSTFWLVFKNYKKLNPKSYILHPTSQPLTLGLLSGLLAISVSNFFGFSTVMTNLLLFLYLAFIVIISDKTKKINLKTNFISEKIIILFILLSLVLLSRVGKTWLADFYYTQGKTLLQNAKYSTGLIKLQQAAALSPREALYYDELANSYSKIAVLLEENNESSTSGDVKQKAIQASNYALKLNPRHLNFYKTKSRVYLNLAILDKVYLDQAKNALEQALVLSPTDPKILYNIALINLQQNNQEQALLNLEKALELKPNYVEVMLELGNLYSTLEKPEEAKKQYQQFLNYFPENQEVLNKVENLIKPI